jgi:dienelactone hydrolase
MKELLSFLFISLALGMLVEAQQFDQLQKANTNPSDDPQMEAVLQLATSDAREAMRLVREEADQWNVQPDRIGYLGFSAGGCVALSAVITNTERSGMPDFIGTAYGPSLIDVVVPESPPPLFIASNADHMNVAAGCLALFTAWKKAGAHAEIHLYDNGQGPFGMRQTGNPSDTWIDSFYTWLLSYGY